MVGKCINKTKDNKDKPVCPCEALCGAAWDPAGSQPLPGISDGFGPVLRLCGGRKKKLDKEPGSHPQLSLGTTARSAGSYGGFGGLENGVKNSREMKFCGRYPAALTPARKNQGSTRRKEAFMSQKEKFALYLTPDMKARLERRYTEDGSRSLTGFIENAINFYLDYLSANNAGMFLPASVQSYLDGRLDQLENRMSSLLYKQAVTLDTGMSVLVDCVHLDETYLRKKRAESAARVKKLNGHLQLEKMAKRAQEQRDGDDGWQD